MQQTCALISVKIFNLFVFMDVIKMTMSVEELARGLAAYRAHLEEIAETFNRAAAECGLALRMDPTKAISTVSSGVGLGRAATFWTRQDDTGVIHQTQLRTMVECLGQLLADQRRCGHVLGAMQSGKTTTSLALQWTGPALYSLRGVKAYPFYIIGSQTSHEDQTTTELDRFLNYYGDVEIHRTDDPDTSAQDLDAVFAHSPSLSNYREHVLRPGMNDVWEIPQLADNVLRRVGGRQGVDRVVELCRGANERGFRPLMIIDEPQFGASDRFVAGEDGLERRSCVLAQMFDGIEAEIGGDRSEHWFVGLSATPFEMNDLERVWEVRQRLTPSYSGFNFFNGRPISPGVDVRPPTTMGLSRFASVAGIPFMANVSMSAYSGTGRAFETLARRTGYQGTHAEYQREVEDALLRTIRWALAQPVREGGPGGLCVRAFNSNDSTEALIGRLDLDPAEVEVIRYYGAAAANVAVKKMIARRRSPDLPYIVFVTNRARMADAFPTSVFFFLELAKRASDLNALLQGLLGRACGYGKRSTVVLSDDNAGIVDAYVATTGGYVHRTSRHSVAVGGYRRGAPTSMLKVDRDLPDPVVTAFFERIDAEVVALHTGPGNVRFSPRRTRTGEGANFRTAPILRIADEVGLFSRLESPAIRAALYPQIPSGFQIARANDAIRHARSGEFLRYQLGPDGNCRFTFRWVPRGASAQGGAQGRAQGARDSGQHMEPTIYIEKYDPATGEIIYDREEATGRPGSWRAFMVTFPLVNPVRELRAAEVAYPVEHSVYDPWMTSDERAVRAVSEARRGRA